MIMVWRNVVFFLWKQTSVFANAVKQSSSRTPNLWITSLCSQRRALIFIISILTPPLHAYTPYGETLCKQPDYTCRKIKRGDSWSQLYPDPLQRDIVKRVNRTNEFLQPGMIIAVPQNLSELTIFDVSPFPRQINFTSEDTIYVDQQKLAWGAYNKLGQLVWWGPVSTGSNRCPDVQDGCLTPEGSFHIKRKQGADCVSNTFPIQLNGQRGGGDMPYCLNFFRGFFLHGSTELPGYPASRGCVRLMIEDARWLNEHFVEVATDSNKGTRVIILNSTTTSSRTQ